MTGLIFGRDEADWKQPGLVISKDLGQPYLVSTPEDGGLVIRPVVNITSARLILGADAEPTYVSEEAINAERIGEPIGILDAPAKSRTPTTGGDRVDRLHAGGHRTPAALATRPVSRRRPAQGSWWRARGSGTSSPRRPPVGGEPPSAYTYALPADRGAQDNMLRDLGLSVGADAMKVPTDWLRLWPVGGALNFDTFGIDGAGEPASYAGGSSGHPGGGRVGDIVTTPGESVVLAPKGPGPLDAFSLAVLRSSRSTGGRSRSCRPKGSASPGWPRTGPPTGRRGR